MSTVEKELIVDFSVHPYNVCSNNLYLVPEQERTTIVAAETKAAAIGTAKYLGFKDGCEFKEITSTRPLINLPLHDGEIFFAQDKKNFVTRRNITPLISSQLKMIIKKRGTFEAPSPS